MRITALTCLVLLAACGQPAPPRDPTAAFVNAKPPPSCPAGAATSTECAAIERGRQDARARAVCEYQGRMAAIYNQSPALIDLRAATAAGSARAACWDLYQRTGIIPGA